MAFQELVEMASNLLEENEEIMEMVELPVLVRLSKVDGRKLVELVCIYSWSKFLVMNLT